MNSHACNHMHEAHLEVLSARLVLSSMQFEKESRAHFFAAPITCKATSMTESDVSTVGSQ